MSKHKRMGGTMGKYGLLARLKVLLEGEKLKVSDYGTHSLHRGGTTFYCGNGMQERAIKKLGRWKSACYQNYDETDLTQVNRE